MEAVIMVAEVVRGLVGHRETLPHLIGMLASLLTLLRRDLGFSRGWSVGVPSATCLATGMQVEVAIAPVPNTASEDPQRGRRLRATAAAEAEREPRMAERQDGDSGAGKLSANKPPSR